MDGWMELEESVSPVLHHNPPHSLTHLLLALVPFFLPPFPSFALLCLVFLLKLGLLLLLLLSSCSAASPAAARTNSLTQTEFKEKDQAEQSKGREEERNQCEE